MLSILAAGALLTFFRDIQPFLPLENYFLSENVNFFSTNP